MTRNNPSIRQVGTKRTPGRPAKAPQNSGTGQANKSKGAANPRNTRNTRSSPSSNDDPGEGTSDIEEGQVLDEPSQPDLNGRTLQAILDKLDDMNGQLKALERRQDDMEGKNKTTAAPLKRKNSAPPGSRDTCEV